MSEQNLVWNAWRRNSAQVHFPDGQTFEGPVQTPLGAYVDAAFPGVEPPIVAAFVDGELEELGYPITRDVSVMPIDTSTNDGMRIYQRSLTFLLVVAVHELLPHMRVIVDHSVTLGGFFCQLLDRDGSPSTDRHTSAEAGASLSLEQMQAVEARMRDIVRADEPIVKDRISRQEAVELFASQGYDDKVRLVESTDAEEVTVYSLRGVCNYFYGYMAPGTGMLRWFSVELYPPGVIMRLPNWLDPTALPARRDYPKLMGIFREYGRWIDILGVHDVGALNQALEDGELRKVILVSEALHEKRISYIADEIVQRRDVVRLVLIAGPSSSGKTTFARRLAIHLMVNGLKPFALGLDDYFVDRDRTPRDETGDYDFEALEAIDLPLFSEQLVALMAGERVALPHYNFQEGESQSGEAAQISQDTVIIVEGIHGLNPKLVSGLPEECYYRIYASALTQLNIDHHNRVPTTDTRLLRRIVRDARYRGYSARQTIDRWESVRRGEERNIFPYQENADVLFNSALVYELAVLKPFAEPLLLRVPRGTMESSEAQRLLAFLRWVHPCEPDLVPDNSLLREFIGGSILRDYEF